MRPIDQLCKHTRRFRHGHGPMALALSLFVTSGAYASTFGDLSSVSAIGNPLRVELLSSDRNLSAGCLRTVSRNAGDGIRSVSGARIDVMREGTAGRIVITRPEPTHDPILRLVIENHCSGSFAREYMLLLPQPAELVRPASIATATAAPAPAARTTGRAPAARGDRWTTAPGESVASLAQALYPRDAGARRAFVSSVLNDNPGVFAGLNDPAASVLPAGTEITVPPPGRMAAASSRPAPLARTATPTRSVAPAPATAEPTPAARPEPARLAAEASQQAGPADRLLLKGEESPSDRDPAVRFETARQADEAVREELLVSAIDRTINVQLELLERIRRLEEIQVALRDQLEPMPTTITASANPAPQSAPVAAVPPPQAAPAPDSTIPDRTPTGPAAGGTAARADATYWVIGLLLLALLLGILLIRRLTAVPETSTTVQRTAARPASTKSAVAPAKPRPVPQAPAKEQHTLVPDTAEHAGRDQAALAWDTGAPETTAPATTQSPLTADDDAIGDHDSAIELAEIMVSFGRISGATETLADFIRANPKQAVTPWLKLLDLYHKTQKRDEFDTLARHLNKTFNVIRITWENFGSTHVHSQGLEHLPHIVGKLIGSWGTRECQGYIETLLRDNRGGTRQGFPLGVIDELLVLSAILEEQLGRLKPPAQSPGQSTA